jgi:hypothetical protein
MTDISIDSNPNKGALQALTILQTLLQIGTFPNEKDVETALRLSLEFLQSLKEQLNRQEVQ